jgi:hypothetical protein
VITHPLYVICQCLPLPPWQSLCATVDWVSIFRVSLFLQESSKSILGCEDASHDSVGSNQPTGSRYKRCRISNCAESDHRKDMEERDIVRLLVVTHDPSTLGLGPSLSICSLELDVQQSWQLPEGNVRCRHFLPLVPVC